MKNDEIEVKIGLVEGVHSMKDRQRKSDKVLAVLRTLSGMIAHFAAFGFTAYIAYIAQPGSSLFSWHPTLMAMAFSFLMTEAILVYNPESSLFIKASRKTKVRIHWLLQTSAVAFAIAGFVIIVLNKTRNNSEHFTSWHGCFGLISVIYVVTQASCGLFLLYPQIPKKWNWKLMQLKVYHATFGLLGYTLVCGTIALALFSKFIADNVTGFAWGLCLFCPACCALLIMNQVTNAYLPITRKSAPL